MRKWEDVLCCWLNWLPIVLRNSWKLWNSAPLRIESLKLSKAFYSQNMNQQYKTKYNKIILKWLIKAAEERDSSVSNPHWGRRRRAELKGLHFLMMRWWQAREGKKEEKRKLNFSDESDLDSSLVEYNWLEINFWRIEKDHQKLSRLKPGSENDKRSSQPKLMISITMIFKRDEGLRKMILPSFDSIRL